jgi:hypothetical protein
MNRNLRYFLSKIFIAFSQLGLPSHRWMRHGKDLTHN